MHGCTAIARVRFLWLLPTMLLALVAFPGCGERADTDAGEVVVYCSADQEFAEPILKAFEEQTGIAVRARFDTEAAKTVGLVQRLRAERENPGADVFWSSEVFHTIKLAREQLLAPVESVPDNWPAELVAPNRHWVGFAARARVICFHTDRVQRDQAPRRLEDLLDAKWKGRVIMADPAFGTTGGEVASWFAHYGPERATEIIRALAANGVRLVDGNSTAVREVASGRADICLTDTDDVYVGQRNGWPVAMKPNDQGGDGTLVIPNTVARVAGGPNPETAERLVQFLLSEQVERMLAESESHNIPIRPELRSEIASEDPNLLMPTPLSGVTYPEIADELTEAIETAREILR